MFNLLQEYIHRDVLDMILLTYCDHIITKEQVRRNYRKLLTEFQYNLVMVELLSLRNHLN